MRITKKLYVTNRDDWRSWLQKNHDTKKEVWLIYCKKHTGKPRIPYDAAVEEALCFGWIDSTVKRINDEKYAQKFTPRGAKSKWSELNINRAKKMIREGWMTKAGLAKLKEIPKNNEKVLNKELWICPKCGNKFVAKNMWHSCGSYDVEDHFKGKEPVVRQLYEKFKEMIQSCGPVMIIPQKTRIVFQVRMRFGGVVTRKKYLIGALLLTKRYDDNERFFKIETFGPRSYGHRFRLERMEDFDLELMSFIREAYGVGEQKHSKRNNEKGLKAKPTKKKLVIPPDLKKALATNKKAWDNFNNFAPSYKRMYVGWITSAKKEETREKRINRVVEWAAQNKKPGMI